MNTAIYYPHFYPSEEWLRLGALLWDRVYTMTIRNTPERPPSLDELNEALGGVLSKLEPWDRNRLSWSLDSEEAEQQFASWLNYRDRRLREQIAESPEEFDLLTRLYPNKLEGRLPRLLSTRRLLRFAARSRNIQIPTWEVASFEHRHLEIPMREVIPPAGSDHERYERLRWRAIRAESGGRSGEAAQLRAEAEDIRSRNLVTVEDDTPAYVMARDVARHFLAFCAWKIAEIEHRDVVTDKAHMTDAIMTGDPTLRGDVATAILEAYIPEDFATAAPEKIAECRRELAAERLRFQAEVQSLVASFSQVASADTYDRLKDQLIEIANERIDATKKAYRKARFDLVQQTVTVSLTPPAVAAAAASALHVGVLAPAGIGAMLSLFAAGKIIELRDIRAQRHQSPWSYVLDLGKNLG